MKRTNSDVLWQTALVVAMLASLTGCANQHAVFRNNSFKTQPAVVTVDAKQRHVFSSNGSMRLCAEASPDIFTVLSSSASADANITDAVAAKFGIAFSESGATIERTQTVNLLRESLYRTCERYLSGAITQEQMVVQAARDQRIMLGVLAIEQLTRTVRPPGTVILGGSTSASVQASQKEAMDNLDEKVAAETDAKAALKTANDEKAKTKPTKPDGLDCETVKQDDKASKNTCTLAATADAKDKTATEAKAQREAAERVAIASASGASAVTGPVVVQGIVPTTLASAAELNQVAATVLEIVKQSNTVDDFLMLCINMLTRSPVDEGKDQDLRSSCVRLAGAAAEARATKFDEEVRKITDARLGELNKARDVANRLAAMSFAKIEQQLDAEREFIGLTPEDNVWQQLLAGIKAKDAPAIAAALRRLSSTVLITQLSKIKE